MMASSGFLTGAFTAVATCVFVHAGLDFLSAVGGPNAWALANILTDGMVSVFNTLIADAPSALAEVAQASGEAGLSGVEGGAIMPIENAIPDGCHAHLNGDIHCGSDTQAPTIDFG